VERLEEDLFKVEERLLWLALYRLGTTSGLDLLVVELRSAMSTGERRSRLLMGNREVFPSRISSLLTSRLETGNAAFANDFSSWIFQESGVVKVVSSTHHRDDETEPRDQYTKKDPVVSQRSSTSQAEPWVLYASSECGSRCRTGADVGGWRASEGLRTFVVPCSH